MILSSRDLQKRQILGAHNARGSGRGSRRILRLSDHTLTASDPLLHSVVVVVVVVVLVSSVFVVVLVSSAVVDGYYKSKCL